MLFVDLRSPVRNFLPVAMLSPILRLLVRRRYVGSAAAVEQLSGRITQMCSVFHKNFHTSLLICSEHAEGTVQEAKKQVDTPVNQPVAGSTTVDLDEEVDEYNVALSMAFPTSNMQNVPVAGQTFGTLPIAHIKASYNNTIISITDYTGKSLYSVKSGGTEGFKNAKKRTDIAAQSAGMSAGQAAAQQGLTHVRAEVKGIGPGRLPCLKGLKASGITVVSLTDITPVPFNGPKPQKRRKL